MKPRALHLGDGAYATITYSGLGGDKPAELMITANSHLRTEASDVVIIDSYGIEALRAFFQRPEMGTEVEA